MIINRSIEISVRDGLSLDEMWTGPDSGQICCWERGREKRNSEPELALRAENGELPVLVWAGGVENRLKTKDKLGSLNYLATWQALRNEDLAIDTDTERVITCERTGQPVKFTKNYVPPKEDEQTKSAKLKQSNGTAEDGLF